MLFSVDDIDGIGQMIRAGIRELLMRAKTTSKSPSEQCLPVWLRTLSANLFRLNVTFKQCKLAEQCVI